MSETQRKAQRGDSFDPPAFCNICRYEMFHSVPHVCDVPIEGTAAWVEPRLEERWMKERSARRTLGDVGQRPQTRQERFPGYDPYMIAGHKIDAAHFDSMRAYYTGRPEPVIDERPTKVTVEVRKHEPIALGPVKPMLMLTTRTLPTYEDFDRLIGEWLTNCDDEDYVERAHEFMRIARDEYVSLLKRRR